MKDTRKSVRTIVAVLSLLSALIVPESHASPDDDPPPRLIARVDVGLMASYTTYSWGGGGLGITIPIGGTGAGFGGAGGAEIGAEVRLWKWIAVDLGAGRYRPKLKVYRDRGPGVRVDSRGSSVDLTTRTFGLVVTPPRWHHEQGRIAIGALVMRAEISDVSSGLGVAVTDRETCLGFDVRGEFFPSRNRRWGIGAALTVVDTDPPFVDQETGFRDSLQVSGMFFRLGVRGAW